MSSEYSFLNFTEKGHYIQPSIYYVQFCDYMKAGSRGGRQRESGRETRRLEIMCNNNLCGNQFHITKKKIITIKSKVKFHKPGKVQILLFDLTLMIILKQEKSNGRKLIFIQLLNPKTIRWL